MEGENRGLNRRELLLKALAAAGASALPPQKLDAQELPITYLESSLSPETLELHKERAAASLRASIPPIEELYYLWDYAEHLRDESQMYIPDPSERSRVMLGSINQRGESQLDVLVQQLKDGETGLYVFADKDEDERHFHRMYAIRKESGNRARFEKAYKVSASEYGFGNEENSNKTTLGLRRVQNGEVGRFAEVVRVDRKAQDVQKREAVESELKRYFTETLYEGVSHWFARSFGEPQDISLEDRITRDKAEVVTARYTIDEGRGVHIHGTNRSGVWDSERNSWITFLGGRRRSSGCIRMSNTDVYDLGLSDYIRTPSVTGKKDGTFVMVHATSAMNVEKEKERKPVEFEYGVDVPRRRIRPGEAGYAEQIQREEIARAGRQKANPSEPAHYIPPETQDISSKRRDTNNRRVKKQRKRR